MTFKDEDAKPKIRAAILISGRGSNMMSLIAASRTAGYPVEFVAVISNRPDAPGLEAARAEGIPALGLDHRLYQDRQHFEGQLDGMLRAARVELVCLAGFMRILTSDFVEAWRDRMLNIHPSLLPAFKGLDTHARALASGARFAGCTVHLVRPEMDDGPILGQAVVPVVAGDDAETLAARVLAAEHLLYPAVLAGYASGAIRLVEGKVVWDEPVGAQWMRLAPAP